jgi:uncharacterized membrane protein
MMINLGSIFREAVDVLKRNYVLAAPSVIATFIVTFLAIALLKSPENMAAMAVMGLLGLILDFFAHAVTLAMAREALEKGQTSIRTGFDIATSFLYHFAVTAAVMAVIIGMGFTLFVIPGLAAMFFLMFTFPSIVMHGLGPVDAFKRSYRLVRANLNDSMLLFAALGAITLGLGLVNLMLSAIPILGQFMSVLITGALGGFTAVAVLRVYITLEAKPKVAQ